ncbi:dihydrofolate reductase family protein [Sphingobacterium sp.]|uniref:dihydrofolate reductase family protein n=1 Tax=Sphingobacterium sp. TaxID=341027 RepID=UPI0028AC0FD3|nr:dihydrofolate reductase family protein [Sphingobacterium sp.]
MKKIIYYVASSIDGFISGENDDVSGFSYDGEAIKKYLEELQAFNHVLMGRKTYEFGYQFGVKPGEPSPTYAHMSQYILSNNLEFEDKHEQVKVIPLDVEQVQRLKQEAETDIYLCGGGQLAGWLLSNELLDEVKIKLNPVIIGSGTKLFEGIKKNYGLTLLGDEKYEDGMKILHYSIVY